MGVTSLQHLQTSPGMEGKSATVGSDHQPHQTAERSSKVNMTLFGRSKACAAATLVTNVCLRILPVPSLTEKPSSLRGVPSRIMHLH